VMMLAAIGLLTEAQALSRPVVMLLHGDEEIGSPASRKLTETLARECAAVYVLEPAQGLAGAYKTARKGVGQYRLEVRGVAAHSGVDFSRGHSAVLELAHQIQAIGKITGCAPGTTVNPGLIGGGTRVNVVAAEAWVEADVRIARARDEARVERALRRLRPRDKACRLDLSGGINRPPMERTRATVALFERARDDAAAMGISLEEAATGGGSDGNFTSALGVPTLDGMGAVGDGAHAPHEYCLRRHLAPRTALLAAMLL
jgi:glutamate carboxypeptidase